MIKLQKVKMSNSAQVKFDTNNISKDCCCICLHIPTLPLQLADCKHSFCYTCVKEHKIKNPHSFNCPLCRAPIVDDIAHIKMDNLDKAIERHINKPFWVYQSKDGSGWWLYEYYMNKRLEELYQADPTSTTNQFVLGVRPYNIDFTTMTQEDSQSKRYRKVQRFDKFEKQSILQWKIRGIAGVYFGDKS
jgi:hypothetical protein